MDIQNAFSAEKLFSSTVENYMEKNGFSDTAHLLIWFAAGMRHAIKEVSPPTKGSVDCAKCTST